MRVIWRIAGSLQTGIILLLLLTVSSLIGVVFPQSLDSGLYISRWGTVLGSLMLSVGFDQIFSTLWFRALLFLFALNVLLCTIVRLKVAVKNIVTFRHLEENKIVALPLHVVTQKEQSMITVANQVEKIFKKHRLRYMMVNKNEFISFTAQRGSFREIGSALLHLSLLPLLIGGLITSMVGFSYLQYLSPGKSAPVRNRTFSVRCDFFSLERNEVGVVKDYKTGLTIIAPGGDTLAQKTIEVNHPLFYEGIKFYQSSYSVDPLSVDSIRLVITGAAIGPVGAGVTVNSGGHVAIGMGTVAVTAGRFVSDFMYDTETKTAISRSKQHDNPALFVTVTDAGDTLFNGWVFKKFGMMHRKDTTCSVAFVSYVERQTTGLLIKENPGSPMIWFGIIGMTLGVVLVFWVPRRRLWVILKRKENGGTVLTAAMSGGSNDPDAGAVWKILQTEFLS